MLLDLPGYMDAPERQRPRRWWTEDEDDILRREAELQLSEGSLKDWNRIAKVLPGRSNKDCRKRWSKVSNQVKKGMWTAEEDRRLEAAVAVHGNKWTKVASLVGTRHADQCAKRWRHSLNPNLDRGEWTQEDDRALLLAVASSGRNWKAIGERRFPARSTTDIKNRFVILDRRRRHTLGAGPSGGKSRSAPPAASNVQYSMPTQSTRLLSISLPPSISAPTSALDDSPTVSDPFFDACSETYGAPSNVSGSGDFITSMPTDPTQLNMWLSMWPQSHPSPPTDHAPPPVSEMATSVPFTMAPGDYSLPPPSMTGTSDVIIDETGALAWTGPVGHGGPTSTALPVSSVCSAGYGNMVAPTSTPLQWMQHAGGRASRRSQAGRNTYYGSPTPQ